MEEVGVATPKIINRDPGAKAFDLFDEIFLKFIVVDIFSLNNLKNHLFSLGIVLEGFKDEIACFSVGNILKREIDREVMIAFFKRLEAFLDHFLGDFGIELALFGNLQKEVGREHLTIGFDDSGETLIFLNVPFGVDDRLKIGNQAIFSKRLFEAFSKGDVLAKLVVILELRCVKFIGIIGAFGEIKSDIGLL